MKKQFLLLGLAVAAMTSCISDEVIEQVQPTKQAIGFESFVNKTTRAITTTDAPGLVETDGQITDVSGLEKFFVHGFYEDGSQVFNGTPVTRTVVGGTALWGYDLDGDSGEEDLAYWTRNIYQFGAYANGNNENDQIENVAFETEGNTVSLTIPSYEVSDDHDLVADIVTVDNSRLTQSTVDLNFKHMLTKVRFTVINNDTKYKMRIVKALVINGAKKQGECVISKNAGEGSTGLSTSWTPGNNAAAVDYSPEFSSSLVGQTYVNNLIVQDGDKKGTSTTDGYMKIGDKIISEEFLVMPQDLAGVKFQITAEFYDNDNQVVTEKVLDLDVLGTEDGNKQIWKANTVYEYTISLPTAAKPIEFGEINVSDWGTPVPVELNTLDYNNNN